jgi:hypothetical protein
MKKLVLALLLSLVLSSSAYASNGASCYTAQEAEAEQGIRIHSELMVIGLTCLKMPQGMSMYQKYQSFTQKNRGLIAQYEKDLIAYYKRTGKGKPEQQLNTLRTTMANQISEHAITMSTATFCNVYGPRVDRALRMDKANIRKWAQHSWPSSPTSHSVCTSHI